MVSQYIKQLALLYKLIETEPNLSSAQIARLTRLPLPEVVRYRNNPSLLTTTIIESFVESLRPEDIVELRNIDIYDVNQMTKFTGDRDLAEFLVNHPGWISYLPQIPPEEREWWEKKVKPVELPTEFCGNDYTRPLQNCYPIDLILQVYSYIKNGGNVRGVIRVLRNVSDSYAIYNWVTTSDYDYRFIFYLQNIFVGKEESEEVNKEVYVNLFPVDFSARLSQYAEYLVFEFFRGWTPYIDFMGFEEVPEFVYTKLGVLEYVQPVEI